MTKPNLKMVGEDGNAFAILGRAHRAARKAGMPEEQWKAIQAEATSGDYSNLLVTMMKYFACDEDDFDPEAHATPEEIAANEAGEPDEDADE